MSEKLSFIYKNNKEFVQSNKSKLYTWSIHIIFLAFSFTIFVYWFLDDSQLFYLFLLQFYTLFLFSFQNLSQQLITFPIICKSFCSTPSSATINIGMVACVWPHWNFQLSLFIWGWHNPYFLIFFCFVKIGHVLIIFSVYKPI